MEFLNSDNIKKTFATPLTVLKIHDKLRVPIEVQALNCR
ncbi:hypothetical protein MalM14_46730 [Gimesia chilikensis]|nr:hypothetical protein MalM14_46730 [Gimesia chilikensis]